MRTSPAIDFSVAFVWLGSAMFFLGFWIWFWFVEWPPSLLQVIAHGIGVLIAVLYCRDRHRHWDTHQWHWRIATRNRLYSRRAYRLAGLGGLCGVISTQVFRPFVSADIRYSVMSAGLLSIGILSAWSTNECYQHLRAYRTHP